MLETELTYFTGQALLLVLWLSLPAIVTATVVGLLVGLLQALTQIQEQTLSFAFKLIAVIVAIMLTARWVGIEMQNFATQMFDQVPLVR